MTLQEQERIFFENLGRALGKWQLVEMQLFRVYARLIRCENAEVASAAFHSIVNFRTRLGMTDAAARVALADSPLLGRWNALRNRASKRSRRRNLLAHFVVVYGLDTAPTSTDFFGPFLEPSIFDVEERKIVPKLRLDVKNIKAESLLFTRLENDLRFFADSLPELASSLGRSI
jgi:hypothetical protein